MKSPTPGEVFIPAGAPTVTYVDRSADGHRLEELIKTGLGTKGLLVSISGPSKSGKTVLVERVVGEYLIPTSGAGIRSPEDLWRRVMAWLGATSPSLETTSSSSSSELKVTAEGGGGLLGVVHAKGGGSLAAGREQAKTTTEIAHWDSVEQIRRELAGSGFVLFIDDFHYIDKTAQAEIARQLKYLASVDVRIVVASVPFRGDDVVRSNHELQGRLMRIDIPKWQPSEIAEIGRQGFPKLGYTVDFSLIGNLQTEACESPQLMQSLCLALSRRLEDSGRDHATIDDVQKSLKFTSLTVDFRNLVKALDQGAKTRGTERKVYTLRDGTTGDVYRVVLKALASDPPRSNFNYQQLLDRVALVCKDQTPTGSSVVGTAAQLRRLAESVRGETASSEIDWDEDLQVLDIPNPFFLYYLRWSGLLMEPQYRTGTSDSILGHPA
jgi:hypothetical protein